ncbi:MAG: hypothetical protein JW938_07775 [Candidatus Omnitrophica bacterium]|nr:hypothetical protein [Candidatus Omnitrophota bacterium]
MARTKLLTKSEEKIIKEQINKNAVLIGEIIAKIDLLMNKEGHRRDSTVVLEFRQKLDVLIAENDTFRKVYWKHVQTAFDEIVDTDYEAVRFLVLRIRNRHRASSGVFACDYQIGVE